MARKVDVEYIRYYTDGSAALQPELQQTAGKTTLPKKRKRKVRVVRIDPVAIGGILVAAVMLVVLLNGYITLRSERKQLQIMQDYVTSLREENHVLVAQCEEQIDLEVIEKQALSMGMVPIEQAQHITIRIPWQETEEALEQVSLWKNISTFLESLFA